MIYYYIRCIAILLSLIEIFNREPKFKELTQLFIVIVRQHEAKIINIEMRIQRNFTTFKIVFARFKIIIMHINNVFIIVIRQAIISLFRQIVQNMNCKSLVAFDLFSSNLIKGKWTWELLNVWIFLSKSYHHFQMFFLTDFQLLAISHSIDFFPETQFLN